MIKCPKTKQNHQNAKIRVISVVKNLLICKMLNKHSKEYLTGAQCKYSSRFCLLDIHPVTWIYFSYLFKVLKPNVHLENILLIICNRTGITCRFVSFNADLSENYSAI